MQKSNCGKNLSARMKDVDFYRIELLKEFELEHEVIIKMPQED